jgi:hypothetical protein
MDTIISRGRLVSCRAFEPLIQKIRRFGYEAGPVERRAESDDVFFVRDAPHSIVRPQATYSPWLADPEFLETYRAISEGPEPHTLVDRFRCYELWQLAARLRSQGTYGDRRLARWNRMLDGQVGKERRPRPNCVSLRYLRRCRGSDGQRSKLQ